MKIVYLDQNKWIELARAAYSKSTSTEASDALEFLRSAKKLGLVALPLSMAHYMETLNRRDAQSRDRLGQFMWELSGGMSMARGPALLEHELDHALWERFPEIVDPGRIRPLQVLGHGLGHARGEPVEKFVVPEEFESLFTPSGMQAFEDRINDSIERSLLGAGVFMKAALAADAVELPDLGEVEDFFVTNLLEVRSWLAKLPDHFLEDGVYFMSLTDIRTALLRARERHSVPVSELASLGWQGIRALIDDLPTQRTSTHMLLEWARNKSLQVKRNDLYDWMALIPATAYCDVVVTENLFADLVNRGGLKKRARVITRLDDLPALLTSLSR